MKVKPFLKWVGGKAQLLTEIEKRFPHQFNNYFEPFLGGGAIFLDISNKFDYKKAVLNDISNELIDAYKAIKLDPYKLMNLLDIHEKEHNLMPEEYYYKIRAQDKLEKWQQEDIFTKSSRLIYLNKFCFNGIYRINKLGYFNVPWNKKTNAKLYDKFNILNLHCLLNNRNIELLNEDFESACEKAQAGDFVFFDPPYDLLKEDTFDSYTINKFGINGQKRLANLFYKLKEKGCYVMLTNHNTPLINDLYKNFTIDVVPVKRLINSDANNRTGVETIIYSY